MNILLIDTSKNSLDIVIKKDEEYFYNTYAESKFIHSVILLDEIENMLKKSGLTFNEIDKFGACTGPGSFTGIRVGISTIKAFAFATKKDTLNVNSLEILAYNEDSNRDIVSVIDAGHDKFYVCSFKNNEKTSAYYCFEKKELLEFINMFDKPLIVMNEELDLGLELEKKVLLDTGKNLSNALKKMLELGLKGDKLEPLYVAQSQAEKDKQNK